MITRPNYNPKTGLHYGVISTRSLADWVMEQAESEYTTCDECLADPNHDAPPDCYCACHSEPTDWLIEPNDPDYHCKYAESLNAIYFIESPYYTHCRPCSPCAPNAGDLDSPVRHAFITNYGIVLEGAYQCERTLGAYCPGLDWYEDNIPCQHEIYSVASRRLVFDPSLVGVQ